MEQTSLSACDISDLRRNYKRSSLRRSQLDPNPFKQFEKWFDEACMAEVLEPNAMVLGTSNGTKLSTRTVLLKGFDDEGFVFFTNYHSRKSNEIFTQPNVSLLFPWYQLERQIIILGVAKRTSQKENIDYFKSRPLSSQISAWASSQSSTIASREDIELKWKEIDRKFINREVLLPDFWGGFRVYPFEIEFWQGRENRLHDRFRYLLNQSKNNEIDRWKIDRLEP